MWLFTKYGFFIVVCARQGDGGQGMPVDTDRMIVRARAAEHLKNLRSRFPHELSGCEIVETIGTDYAGRLFVDKPVWVKVASHLAEETDYDNFKSAVSGHMGMGGYEYADRLHEVWNTMYKFQQR